MRLLKIRLMVNMKRVIISIILVLLWMGFIYYMSSMNSDDSNNVSIGVIDSIVDTSTKDDNDVDIMNTIIRKMAHASIYLVLGILVLNVFISINKNITYKHVIFTIIICLIYAISDEIHQLYVIGRTGRILDVFIDSIGSIIGSIILFKIKNKSLKN